MRFFCAANSGAIDIVSDGKSEYTIVVPDKPLTSIKMASIEMKTVHKVPKPLDEDLWMAAELLPIAKATLSDEWEATLADIEKIMKTEDLQSFQVSNSPITLEIYVLFSRICRNMSK